MKQKLKRFMAGFMAMLTLVGTLFTNGTTAFAADVYKRQNKDSNCELLV